MKTTTIRATFLAALLILPVLLWTGCGEDGPTANGRSTNDQPGQSGVVQGNLVPKGGDFEMPSNSTDDGAPEFTLYGRDIAYDTDSGELVVNLSVINDGDESYDETVALSFLSLLPDGVTVTNPDNEEHGAGAMIAFGFENDDAMWTPGEESLPREARFAVDEDVAIGFSARVDVGMGAGGMGSIGGVVFDDADGDGMMGTEEGGVAGVTIVLSQEGAEDQTAVTGEDGGYRFDGLDSGFYSVSKQTMDDSMTATTPTTVHVILVEDAGGMVVSFMAANFGCMQDDGSQYGEITGTVYDDANENGMMDTGEMGISNVSVSMTGPNGFNGAGTTDASGNYIFSNPMAGDYTVEITVPEGYTATTPASVTVTLADQEDSIIDFGLVATPVEQ